MLATGAHAPKSKATTGLEKTRSADAPPAASRINPRWACLALGIQAKLRVGAADDPAEEEADRVADHVLRMPDSMLQRQCAGCAASSTPKREDEERPHLQRWPSGELGPTEVASDFTSRLGSGEPLDSASRAYFEPRFGHDFTGVRIHTGTQADVAATSIQARAFTLGRDVVFAAGAHDSRSESGRRLLAHELTHVVQQDGGGRSASRMLMREAISLRSSHQVTDVTPGPTDNVREDVLSLLDRLHTLWSIDNSGYDNQHIYISALAAGALVPQTDPAATPPWTFQPTMDALRRNREPTLAGAVINHHMGGLAVSDGVGRGLRNNQADVLAVQDRLHFLAPYPSYATERAAVAALSTPTVPDPGLGGTFGAITDFKIGIASGEAGWLAVRASESEFGGDRFAGQTTSHTITVRANHTAQEGAAFETQEPIQVSIFLPAGLTPGQNKVFLFFSPGDGTETVPNQPGGNATNVHAIRSGADPGGWIVIGIPGFRATSAERGWNTINTSAVQSCLTRAGRGTRIDALRLAGHSRGGRGLTRTVALRLIDVGLIDRVFMLDQPHAGLAASLAAGASPGSRPAPIIDYSQGDGGGTGTALNAQGVRAIGFARLVQDRSDVPPPAAAATLLAPILADLPPRGSFTTQPVAAGTTSGKTNIHDWVSHRHPAEVAAIARADERAEAEWKRFVRAPTSTLERAKVDPSPWFHVNTQNLMRFFAGPLLDASGRPVLDASGRPVFGFPLGIYAHHLFVAEISEELFR
jgi:hypothetical protein